MNLIWICYFIPLSYSSIYISILGEYISVSFEFSFIHEDTRLSFGSSAPKEGIEGSLIRPKDNVLGCNVSIFGPGSIPLLERGGCNLLDKVLMMQKSGALAVIIGNYIENPNDKIQILGKDENIMVRIPALLIQRLDYFAMLKLLQDQDAVISIKILRDESDESFFNVLLIAFVWPLALLGIFNLCLYLNRAWNMYKKTYESEFAISHTPIRTYQSDGSEESWCCICLEFYENGDQVKYLRCNHVYHQSCIDEWLYYSCVCPLCKVEVVDGQRI